MASMPDRGFPSGRSMETPSATRTRRRDHRIVVTANVPKRPKSFSGSPSSRQISLSWKAPDDDCGATVDYYEYKYRADGTALWTTSTTSSTSVDLTGLADDTEYNLEVRAHNTKGFGSKATTSATTPNRVEADLAGQFRLIELRDDRRGGGGESGRACGESGGGGQEGRCDGVPVGGSERAVGGPDRGDLRPEGVHRGEHGG